MTSHVAAAAPTTAQAVAKKLDIDAVIAGVLPDQKMEAIKRLRKDGRFVAMAGDAMIAAAAMRFGSVSVSVIGNALRLRRAHVQRRDS